MRYYEIAFLISKKEEKPETLYKEIINFIEENKGKIKKIIPLKEVKLAHPINKETRAILASIEFDLEPDQLKKIREKINSSDLPILRFLIIKRRIEKENKKIRNIVKPKEKENKKNEENKKENPPIKSRPKRKVKKVELKEVDKKIEEILKN